MRDIYLYHVRKTDLLVAARSITSQVVIPDITKGVLRSDRLRHDPWRLAWQLVLEAGT
jgi:hypothetical protein